MAVTDGAPAFQSLGLFRLERKNSLLTNIFGSSVLHAACCLDCKLTETTTYLVYGVLSREKKERLTTVDAKSPPMALVIGTIERMGGTDETNYSKSWPVTNCRVALFNVERKS